MRWRAHGANPEKLYKQFGIEMPENVLDFSTNTNVLQPETDEKIDFWELTVDYPDDDATGLAESIAERNGLGAENVLVTNGSNEAIYILASLYKKAAILQPTYGEYKRACFAYGCQAHDIASTEDIPQGTELLVVCNPNNPTGKYIDAEMMGETARICKTKGIDLAIDEAYVDFVLKDNARLDVAEHKNVYILRSMTKIYNLAGIRLGYVLADAVRIERLKKRQPTWSVNAVAQALGELFLRNDDFLNKTRSYYKSETARLKAAIQSLGFKIMPSDTHYFLMAAKDDEKLIRHMLQRGIVLRHTRSFVGLCGRYVRICTREREANDRLIEALMQYKEL